MRSSLLVAAALALSPTLGLAQGVTVGVGAAGPPDEVVTYVQRERAPSVTVQEDVVVGHALPSSVELRSVPSSTEYRYAVVNNKRVIVEPSTRKIIKIIE
jgi:hypothetical protein